MVLETSTLENQEIFFKQPFPELNKGRLPRDLAVKATLAFDLRPALPRFCHAAPAEQAAEQGDGCQGEEWKLLRFFASILWPSLLKTNPKSINKPNSI